MSYETRCTCREDLQFLPAASRQVDMGDFRKVLETFRPSGQHSQEYRQEQANTGQARLGMPLPSCPARDIVMASVPCCVAAVQHPDLCGLVQHPQEYRQEQASDGQPCILKVITTPVLHE